jgi:hypothetical protein
MPSKTTALSVRVSDEDARFLSGLSLDGATTPSEKLRALLSAQRRLHEGARSPTDAAETIEDLLRPSLRRVRRAEAELGVHSEPVQRVFDRLPVLAGLAQAGPQGEASAPDAKALAAFEGQLLEHAAALCEELINLAMTTSPRAYSPDSVEKRLKPLIELAHLTRIAQKQSEGE